LILDRVAETTSAPHELDVIGGNAGAIPALLFLARRPELNCCRPLAVALGEELCAAAVRQGGRCFWDSKDDTCAGVATGPMTGFSHGAAGIGLALLELHAAIGRSDFLEIARDAFAYVDSLFHAEKGNWTDVGPPARSPSTDAAPTFSMAWCHGAPGIALARLRAGVLDPELRENHNAIARIAIEATVGAIDKAFADPHADASVCHGLAGLAEAVHFAGEMLHDSSYHASARALAQALIGRHAEAGDWPSGVPSGGPNPSLMLGLAGIGYWLLRLHDPAKVPPFLLLIPGID
jgi:lantibiotic modifying enzyme